MQQSMPRSADAERIRCLLSCRSRRQAGRSRSRLSQPIVNWTKGCRRRTNASKCFGELCGSNHARSDIARTITQSMAKPKKRKKRPQRTSGRTTTRGGSTSGVLPYAMALATFEFPGHLSAASVDGVAYLPNRLHSSRMSVGFSQTVESADRISWLSGMQLSERSVLRTAPERSF